MKQLVNEYSKGPYISFWAIEIVDEAFRTHIEWATNGYILEDLVCLDGKAKVAEFISVLMDKNIRYFKITVDDAEIGKILECFKEREYNFWEGLLVELAFLGE